MFCPQLGQRAGQLAQQHAGLQAGHITPKAMRTCCFSTRVREQALHGARRYLLEPRELRDSACMQLSMDCRVSAVDGSFSLSQPPCKPAMSSAVCRSFFRTPVKPLPTQDFVATAPRTAARQASGTRGAVPDADKPPQTPTGHCKALCSRQCQSCQPPALHPQQGLPSACPAASSLRSPSLCQVGRHGQHRAMPRPWVPLTLLGLLCTGCLAAGAPAPHPLVHPSQAQPDCESRVPRPHGKRLPPGSQLPQKLEVVQKWVGPYTRPPMLPSHASPADTSLAQPNSALPAVTRVPRRTGGSWTGQARQRTRWSATQRAVVYSMKSLPSLALCWGRHTTGLHTA